MYPHLREGPGLSLRKPRKVISASSNRPRMSCASSARTSGMSTLSLCSSLNLPGGFKMMPFPKVSQKNLVRLAAPVTPASPPMMLRVISIPTCITPRNIWPLNNTCKQEISRIAVNRELLQREDKSYRSIHTVRNAATGVNFPGLSRVSSGVPFLYLRNS
jgi:hypothetical protein